jgi:predicted DNA-binding transcriptional regulator
MIKDATDNFNEFFELAYEDLKESDIKISFKMRKRIKLGDDWCGGFFDGKELAVAINHPNAAEIFTHEYCHYRQFKDNSPLWEAVQRNNIFSFIEKGLFGKKWWSTIYDTISLERDCEMRVLEINREFNLFDEVTYTKNANAYLYFHQYVFVNRSWKGSCNDPLIVDAMPSKIVSLKKLEKIDPKIMKLFEIAA